MEHIPLSDACLSEVLARVSYRWIAYLYKHRVEVIEPPNLLLSYYSRVTNSLGFNILSAWLMAYAREWSPMTPTKFVRDAFIFRARQGYTWRRVVYPEYKRNRSDPRVTNRGVAREGFSGEIEQ
jgi:hypothetical protein